MFTNLAANPTPSGGDIFLCVKKDIEERHAKELRSRPLDSGFLYGGMMPDVRTWYVFALVHFTRFRLVRRRAGGVRFARLRRKAKHRLFATISLPQALLPPDSCLLLQVRQKRWHSKNNQRFANLTPSGGDIFLCVKKDIEERHAKGLQSRPLESCFYTGE